MSSSDELRELLHLPTLPDGWTWKRLGELVDPSRGICYGIVQPGKHQHDGVPMVNSQDILDGLPAKTIEFRVARELHERFRRSTIRGGEILLTLVGANFGRSVIAPLEYAGFNCSRPVGIIPVLGNAQFVMYCLQSPITQRFLNDWANTTAQPTLNLKEAAELPIPFPPSGVQDSIADLLGTIDRKIESNRRKCQALEALARATFKAWFVDFEPVEAKAAGQTSFPGMPPAAFAALPDRLTDSPLGQLPEGWKVGKLGEYCQINKKSVRPGQIDGEIEYIDIASVSVGRLDSVQRVPFADAPSRARRRVGHGDTIWSCVRPNRRSYLFIHSPPENRIASTGFAVLSPAILGASYLHELVTRPEFVDYLVANADGSAYPAVRPEHFATADVLIPPATIQGAFEEITMPLRDLLAANEAESAKLAVLRDYLQPRLLSGQVRVVNAQEAG